MFPLEIFCSMEVVVSIIKHSIKLIHHKYDFRFFFSELT